MLSIRTGTAGPRRHRRPCRGAATAAAAVLLALTGGGAVLVPPPGAAQASASPPPAAVGRPDPDKPTDPPRAAPSQAIMFISAVGRQTVTILTDGSLAADERDARLRRLLRRSFDLGLIARFALGPYWRAADPEQVREYQRLFGDFLLDLYAARFKRQIIRTFRVLDARPAGRKDVVVATRFERPGGPSIGAEWRVRRIDGRLRIIDVTIAGVSMALTYRSEFVSFVERNGGAIDRLIAKLRRRTI